jgi:hypothetical protein
MNLNTTTQTVFYSWLKDLENRTNRTFIQEAIELAINNILETNLEIDLVLDRDTKGIPGSPDIAQTILQKIDQALVVVADVSIINPKSETRLTPNPNVLFELGYAVKSLSWDNVLPVFNLATGRIEDLPFDLRSHRPITYKMSGEADDKNTELRKLGRTLQEALHLILKKQSEKRPKVRFIYQPQPSRIGIINKGSVPIEIVKFTIEYPRSIGSSRHSQPPLVSIEELQYEDGTPTYRHILIKTDAPISQGYNDNSPLRKD